MTQNIYNINRNPNWSEARSEAFARMVNGMIASRREAAPDASDSEIADSIVAALLAMAE